MDQKFIMIYGFKVEYGKIKNDKISDEIMQLPEKDIISKSSNYVSNLFLEKLPEWARYHTISHTIETVKSCIEIGSGSGLNGDEIEVLTLAGWFHDTGYLFSIEAHEEKSIELASAFLLHLNYPNEKIALINRCILATKLSREPKDLIESIIRDADLISLGKKDFFEKDNLLKEEIQLRNNVDIIAEVWKKRTRKFLLSHSFLTEYGDQKYNEQFEKNKIILKKQINDLMLQ